MSTSLFSLCQISPEYMEVEKNCARICAFMEKETRRENHLLLLPELGLTGYGLKKEALGPEDRRNLAARVASGLDNIRRTSERTGLGVAVSYPALEAEHLFIEAACFWGGDLLGVHRKLNLCNYGIYREHENFSPGEELRVVDTPAGKLALLICEDLWHPENAILAVQRGAEVILGPSAPCVLSREEGAEALKPWHHILRGMAVSQVCWVLCCCRTGAEGEAHFFGGSCGISPQGELALELPLFEEAQDTLSVDMEALRALRSRRPLGANLRRGWCAREFGRIASKS